MKISINVDLKTPIYLQIAGSIKTMIFSNEIMDGFVLPSQRAMASQLGVHRNTVIRAYNELEAEGFVQPKQGVGYSVTYKKNEDLNISIGKVNWQSRIKDQYQDIEISFDDLFSKTYSEDTISFAGGMASSTVYKKEDVIEGLSEVLEEAYKESYFYTPYQGIYSLRCQISTFLRGKGILAGPSEIQILSETNQALDYILTLLVDKGDRVITEEPISPDIHRALELAGVKAIGVPMDEEGMICDNLEALIEKHNPKFIYVNSSYHDPTGIIMSIRRREKILNLSYKYRIPIIEDDATSEINFAEGVPSIKAMDKGKNVIYIYSFAMTLIPGINIAFVAAPKRIIKSMSYLLSLRLVSLDWISQKLLEYYFKNGIYKDNTKKLIKEYENKCNLMCSYLDTAKTYGVSYRRPSGGVYLWCKLRDSMDPTKLFDCAAKCGVSFIPGNLFFPHKNPPANYIRLNYSRPTEKQIEAGMSILIDLMKR